MTDESIISALMTAAPTFAANWRLTESHYPSSDPETLPSALYVVASHIHALMVKDRHRELAPLLSALERAYESGTPTQREHIRRCVIESLVRDCREMGLDANLYRSQLGASCEAAWCEIERSTP